MGDDVASPQRDADPGVWSELHGGTALGAEGCAEGGGGGRHFDAAVRGAVREADAAPSYRHRSSRCGLSVRGIAAVQGVQEGDVALRVDAKGQLYSSGSSEFVGVAVPARRRAARYVAAAQPELRGVRNVVAACQKH